MVGSECRLGGHPDYTLRDRTAVGGISPVRWVHQQSQHEATVIRL